MKISINGKFVEHITLNGTEPEFNYGYGVFETLRTYNKNIFHLTDHLKRLHQSAQELQITLAYPNHVLTQWLNQHCENLTQDLRIKIIATPKKIYILSEPLIIKPQIYTKGVALKLYQLERQLPTVKKISFDQEYLAHQAALSQKYYDALLINHKQEVTEGAYGNFFYIRNDTIYSARYNILAGITREIIVKLAAVSYEVKLQKMQLTAVLQADECFLTHTSAGMVPVVAIDKHKINQGKVGPITQDLLERFNDYTLTYTNGL